MKTPKHFDLFVDGSCLRSGQPDAEGGWAFVVTAPNSTKIVPGTENLGKLRAGSQDSNRAELEAVLRAVLWIHHHGEHDAIYTIWSDQKQVVTGIQGDTSRTANRDIWTPIERIIRKERSRIRVDNVDAHAKNSTDPRCLMNNYVDALAKKAANSLLFEPVHAII